METNPFRAQRLAPRPPPPMPPLPPAPEERRNGIAWRTRAWVAERVAGRVWYYRAPLLVVFSWFLVGYLGDPRYRCIFDGLNLGFHEAGHAAFSWLGNRILTTAGGTIFQLLIPLLAGIYLARKQRDPFGAAVCLFWLGTALVGAGVYAADARAQALPLVSPFGPVDVDSHDWTVMLMKFGLLSRDEQIGGFLVAAGRVAMTLSLVAGAWVLRVMARTPTREDARGARPTPATSRLS
jgi:hypothetical protein